MTDVRIQPDSFSTRGLRGRAEGLLLRFPSLVLSFAVFTVAAVVLGTVFATLHGRTPVAVGQLAPETRLVRVPLAVEDELATDAYRAAARERAARVYIMDPRVLPELRVALENLPRAVAAAPSLDAVAARIRDQFALSDAALAALRPLASGDAATDWAQRIDKLDQLLRENPLIDQQAYQIEAVTINEHAELRDPSATAAAAQTRKVPTKAMLPLGSEVASRALRACVATAGFSGIVGDTIFARLIRINQPTHLFDQAATLSNQSAAAEAVEPRTVSKQVGQVIFAEGERLTPEKVALYSMERKAFTASQTVYQRLVGILAPAGSGVLIVAAMVAFIRTYAAGLLVLPGRLAVYVAIVVGCMVAGVTVAVNNPWLLTAAVAGAAALVTIVSAAMYDRRLAFGMGTMACLGLCIAMHLPVSMVAIALCGVGVVAWTLRELRQRNTLIKTAALAASAAAAAALLFGLLDRPLSRVAIDQAVWEAGTTGAAVLLTGFLVLGVLPWLERLLGVTTGLTLVDLRDPQHPLLRELQQRAPGTYNHSLNVASLAEAAAGAIGADTLLAYVGSLYHDVGKMNKPEYFVENQTAGINRHDRLTPAMSLLVIVSHVRDGIELAREHRLPVSLHHFIEAHHGTTLVEYFFARARKQAEKAEQSGEDVAMPLEVEYRYPGPRPRTKEVAIIMVCDAAESATRSLNDPSAAKIESMVRAIAHKRLMDGQFDECALTLGELNTVVEAISRTLVAMNHQRIAYPEARARAATKSGPAQPSAEAEPTRSPDPRLLATTTAAATSRP
jgi:putative nucleotidyltransferase with HDIG domain